MNANNQISRRRILGGVSAITALGVAGSLAGCSSNAESSSSNGISTVRDGVLSVATISDGRPNSWIENGEFKGFDLELVRGIAQQVGLRVEFAAIEFPALLPAVAQGRYDMGAASIAGTVERQKVCDFSTGYLGGYLGVLTSKTSGITEDHASTSGKRLGLVQGTIQEAYARRFLPQAVIVTFPDNNAGVAALTSGRVDAFFLDFVVGTDYIEQRPDLVQPIAIPAFDQPAAFPFRKGNNALRDALNSGIQRLVADGTWLKLYKEFFSKAPEPQSLPPYSLPGS